MEVTVESTDLKKANNKLLARRDRALETIEEAKVRKAAAVKELAEVDEKLALAKERFDDPSADQQLASAHRELSRLRTDVETLRYEKELGYTFLKNGEGEEAALREELEALREKEGRKKAKSKKVTFDRDAAREEYMAWTKNDTARDTATALRVLGNAGKILEKTELLRKRARMEEMLWSQAQKNRGLMEEAGGGDRES